ncbi:MAG: hypothetical protein KA313_10510 [Pseudarcicella sp.]|nr:hypothetical protein [Pseudarcicella sp.]
MYQKIIKISLFAIITMTIVNCKKDQVIVQEKESFEEKQNKLVLEQIQQSILALKYIN